jgi:hypothetical protein
MTSHPKKLRISQRLGQLGPGLITGAADDDPSGIATYSQAGAQFGYSMLWTVVVTLPLMAAIQIVSARIGYVTRRGLAANTKVAFPRWVLLGVVGLLLVANTLNVAADIAAMAEASLRNGASGVRLESPEHIGAVRRRCPDALIVGLWKRTYGDSPVYITPGWAEIQAVWAAGADVVAIDATERPRPEGLWVGQTQHRKGFGRVIWAEAPIVPDQRFLRSSRQQRVQPKPPF